MTNILVTGGCGFIASNFINYYFEKNQECNIFNIDAMYYCANEKNVKEHIRNSPRYKLFKGNLCSTDLVNHIINHYQIDCVIHFAAQSHVQNSFNDSLQYTQDNIVGTHTLLEVCRKYGKLKRFIHVSTDEVYGESMLDDEENKKTESSVLCPTNPYAASKAGAELIAQAYYHSFKMPIIITRGNNVFGPNQYPEKLVPLFIKLLKEDKKVTIQGDGSNVRAFLHVYDVCTAFKLILEKGIIGEIYNIGSDDDQEYTVMEVAKILIKLIKNTEDYDKYITYIEDRPFNDKRYYISNQKLKDLGWKINIDFIDGIKELVFNEYKNKVLIDKKYLENIENNIILNEYFGDWINKLEELQNKFINAKPFSYIIIDNFLKDKYANIISEKFPNVDPLTWHKYDNPIELKYALDNLELMPKEIKDLFYILSTKKVTEIFSKITNISNLEYDEYLNGAGLHAHPRNGKLNLHLDYEKHPISGKERRCNIILYLSKKWNKEWNGQTEFWNEDVTDCEAISPVKFNSIVLFKTNDISWHGLPEPLKCPDNIFRKSFAYYYVSSLESKKDINEYRLKAKFVKRPNDEDTLGMQELYKIRAYRRITLWDKLIYLW